MSARGVDRAMLSNTFLHRQQRRHFLLFDVLPFVATLAALALLWVQPVGCIAIVLFGAMWLLTGLGLSVGYHRLFAHAAFATTRPIAATLLVLGSMAARGPMTVSYTHLTLPTIYSV